MIITGSMINGSKSTNNAHTKYQNKLAIKRFGSIPLMLGQTVENTWWARFYELRLMTKTKKRVESRLVNDGAKLKNWTANQSKPKKKTILNSVSPNLGIDWSWKPEKTDIPEIKFASKNSKSRGRKKAHRAKVSKLDNSIFYQSEEWRYLRVRVLEKYACKCMMCGQSPKEHKIVIHVDHIKPRSKFPELSLDIENLQLLCADCNLGKSNKFDTDWRPETKGVYL